MALFEFYLEATAVQIRVLRAVLMRDTRTRFGGRAGSVTYLIVVGLPLLHLSGLMLIPVVFSKGTPLGPDFAVFAATGVLPYILCLYPSRWTMLSLVENRPLLAFPVVSPPDLIIGRALLEVVVALTVTLIFLLVLYAAGFEVVPIDAAEATAAILSTIFFGVSLGFVSAVMLSLLPAWLFVHILLTICMYITSGALFLVRDLPPFIRDLIWYNPLFHCVEWLRLAYFAGYGGDMLSKSYLLGFATALLFAGTLGERLLRGRIMLG